jgi:hypothetical protein
MRDKAKKRLYDQQYSKKNRVKINARLRDYYKREYARKKKIEYTRRQKRTPAGRFTQLKYTAKARNMEMNLTLADLTQILLLPCHYCGGKLNETGYGLDRKDNAKGYTIENVVPCCDFCNKLKSNLLSYGEMVVVSGSLKAFRNCSPLAHNHTGGNFCYH